MHELSSYIAGCTFKEEEGFQNISELKTLTFKLTVLTLLQLLGEVENCAYKLTLWDFKLTSASLGNCDSLFVFLLEILYLGVASWALVSIAK